MLGANVLTDLDIQTLPSQLQTATSWGSERILKQLQNPTDSISELKRIQIPLLALRHSNTAPHLSLLQSELTKQIAPHCSVLDECEKHEKMDSRIQESVHQILWSPSSYFSKCNTSPKIIQGFLHWKTLFVPFFSVLMPIIAIIAPFFLIRFLNGPDAITVERYFQHVKQTLLNQITIPTILRAKHEGDIFGKITETIVIFLTMGTFLMGLWNQIQSAMHLRSIAKNLIIKGDSLKEIVQSSQRILDILKSLPPLQKKGLLQCIQQGEICLEPLLSFSGGLAGFGQVWNTPILFNPLKEWIGHLDAQITIATAPSICFPRFKKGVDLCIKNLYHPMLVSKHSVVNDAEFKHPKSHVLLTGPNRGGKSTFCKSLGLSILYAQTWGVAWATSMSLEPFQRIETALSPTDVLGKMSLFEAEIEFAKHILQKAEQGQKIFIMMDEIFHSTNAHDGIEASRIFLNRLYNCKNTTSLISTHYHELIKFFEHKIQAWQMIADQNSDGTLLYTYKCQSGISNKSSVMEILKERQLAA